MKVKELKGIEGYLRTQNIFQRYLKAKAHIEAGRYNQVQFKLRQPKSEGVF